jgi:hypothetical protein
MILNKDGQPISDIQRSIGEQYWEAFARAERGSKLSIMRCVLLGWTHEQTQRYIETGEEPPTS